MKYVLFILFTLFIFVGCTEKGEDRIYLLPKDFVGSVVILFDQPDGVKTQYIGGEKRLFEIPLSGVLKTRFEVDYGMTRFPEFYYTTISDQTKIPLVIEEVDYSITEINATMPNVGKLYPDSGNEGPTEYSIFYIGTKDEIKSAKMKLSKVNILDLK